MLHFYIIPSNASFKTSKTLFLFVTNKISLQNVTLYRKQETQMPIRTIKLMGDPTLYQRTREIDDPKDIVIQKLIKDLKDTLNRQKGVGIAATQIGEYWRVIVIQIPPKRAAMGKCESMPQTTFINPILTPLSDEIYNDAEGCFSIPKIMGEVPRYRYIHYRAISETGQRFQGEARNLFARILQHEVDHLDGILYWFRITDKRKFGFLGHIPHIRDPRSLHQET